MGRRDRPKRDDQRAREVADLKRANHQLRRELSRLRKEAGHGDPPGDPEAREPMPKDLPGGSGVKCPLCQSKDTTSFETPGGKIRYGCKTCQKWRA